MSTGSTSFIRRLYDRIWTEVGIAFLALIVAFVSLGITVAIHITDEADEVRERAIKEVDRVFEATFLNSLTVILNHAYGFIENPDTKSLKGKERFEKFWHDLGNDADSNMLVIYTRLSSIQECVARKDCEQADVFSRFPDTVYQSLFFLREFIFLPKELQAANTNGWWVGNNIYDFLSGYCRWAYGTQPTDEGFWSPRHEQIRRDEKIPVPPGPCLPVREESPPT